MLTASSRAVRYLPNVGQSGKNASSSFNKRIAVCTHTHDQHTAGMSTLAAPVHTGTTQCSSKATVHADTNATTTKISHIRKTIHKNIHTRGLSTNITTGSFASPNVNVNATTKRSLSTKSATDPHDRLIVIGSGVAGCSSALIAAERYKIPVTLLCAGSAPTDNNSYWAQGGIIYRNYDPKANDSAASLVADVQRAGAGLCEDGAVWKLALDGPDRVRQLLLDDKEEGGNGNYANVPFDRNEDGSLSCCLEASHASPRIIHFADHTGKAITEHITTAALNHPLISVVTDTIVTDLVTTEVDASSDKKVCLGTHTFNKKTGERESLLSTRGTVLASGGLAGIYEHSTNPAGFNALGSSAALASRAGAHTSDLEYVQFHPTALHIPNESCFLLTEALRGEGAVLRDRNGRAFAKDFHPDGELAPRDIVARGVFNENQKVDDSIGNNVFLDISHRDSDWLKGRFPSIDAHLMKRGMDITKDHLPITPAAHYTCGGVTTDLEGCTNIVGLFSAGEAARTGLHGGNRLASTSLLEGLVFGGAIGDYVGSKEQGDRVHEILKERLHSTSSQTVIKEMMEETTRTVNTAADGEDKNSKEGAAELLKRLKRVMWDHVGVVRTPIGLTHAAMKLSEIKEEADHLYAKNVCVETAGIRDAAFAGEEVAKAALANRVSAGAHCIVLESPEASSLEAENTIEAPKLWEDMSTEEEAEIGGSLRLR